MIDDLQGTYIEIFQSKKGLHIFSKGRIKKNFNNQKYKVEMYQKSKCIAMTRDILIDSLSIIDKQEEIDIYYKKYYPKEIYKEQTKKVLNYSSYIPCIDIIVSTMCKYNYKAKDLFEGIHLSGDVNKDDFRLLLFLNSYTHGNCEIMRAIFLKSALNRIHDRSKRRNDESYLKYLDTSINNAIKIGSNNY